MIINNFGPVVYHSNNQGDNEQINIEALNLIGFMTIQVKTNNSVYNQKVIVI